MKKYSCKCPAPGCDFVLEKKAVDREEAFKEMYAEGSQHLVDKHPDFPHFEDPEGKAREYALKNMKEK
jgi:hypothetical protein